MKKILIGTVALIAIVKAYDAIPASEATKIRWAQEKQECLAKGGKWDTDVMIWGQDCTSPYVSKSDGTPCDYQCVQTLKFQRQLDKELRDAYNPWKD